MSGSGSYHHRVKTWSETIKKKSWIWLDSHGPIFLEFGKMLPQVYFVLSFTITTFKIINGFWLIYTEGLRNFEAYLGCGWKELAEDIQTQKGSLLGPYVPRELNSRTRVGNWYCDGGLVVRGIAGVTRLCGVVTVAPSQCKQVNIENFEVKEFESVESRVRWWSGLLMLVGVL